jgi:hypothetical protein
LDHLVSSGLVDDLLGGDWRQTGDARGVIEQIDKQAPVRYTQDHLGRLVLGVKLPTSAFRTRVLHKQVRHIVYAGDTALHIAASAYEAGIARQLITSARVSRLRIAAALRRFTTQSRHPRFRALETGRANARQCCASSSSVLIRTPPTRTGTCKPPAACDLVALA